LGSAHGWLRTPHPKPAPPNIEQRSHKNDRAFDDGDEEVGEVEQIQAIPEQGEK
jgi:hypothetical protein